MAAKITPAQAAAKAFRAIRLNHDKAKHGASYMAKQYLIASGASQAEASAAVAEMNGLLTDWFAQRETNPAFTPDVSATPTPTPAPVPQPEPTPALEAN